MGNQRVYVCSKTTQKKKAAAFHLFLEEKSEFNTTWCQRYGSESREPKVNRFSAHGCFALSRTCRA